MSPLTPRTPFGHALIRLLSSPPLSPSYDSRVKAMEVDEKPKEEYTDVGGLDKQIEVRLGWVCGECVGIPALTLFALVFVRPFAAQELVEAVVLPMTQSERFKTVGIVPPKGVLLYGPPGTGKTLLARACAKQTDAVFLKLAGPQLVQMYIGDGAKVRAQCGEVFLCVCVQMYAVVPPSYQMVRDAFELAKEKCKERNGAIIFIDEVRSGPGPSCC